MTSPFFENISLPNVYIITITLGYQYHIFAREIKVLSGKFDIS